MFFTCHTLPKAPPPKKFTLMYLLPKTSEPIEFLLVKILFFFILREKFKNQISYFKTFSILKFTCGKSISQSLLVSFSSHSYVS